MDAIAINEPKQKGGGDMEQLQISQVVAHDVGQLQTGVVTDQEEEVRQLYVRLAFHQQAVLEQQVQENRLNGQAP